jgi:hypothetical protein
MIPNCCFTDGIPRIKSKYGEKNTLLTTGKFCDYKK